MKSIIVYQSLSPQKPTAMETRLINGNVEGSFPTECVLLMLTVNCWIATFSEINHSSQIQLSSLIRQSEREKKEMNK